tara:strand:- start:2669 stop:3673 length:1005 start_codon:yes stop_codon:yes gene_type:complete
MLNADGNYDIANKLLHHFSMDYDILKIKYDKLDKNYSNLIIKCDKCEKKLSNSEDRFKQLITAEDTKEVKFETDLKNIVVKPKILDTIIGLLKKDYRKSLVESRIQEQVVNDKILVIKKDLEHREKLKGDIITLYSDMHTLIDKTKKHSDIEYKIANYQRMSEESEKLRKDYLILQDKYIGLIDENAVLQGQAAVNEGVNISDRIITMMNKGKLLSAMDETFSPKRINIEQKLQDNNREYINDFRNTYVREDGQNTENDIKVFGYLLMGGEWAEDDLSISSGVEESKVNKICTYFEGQEFVLAGDKFTLINNENKWQIVEGDEKFAPVEIEEML